MFWEGLAAPPKLEAQHPNKENQPSLHADDLEGTFAQDYEDLQIVAAQVLFGDAFPIFSNCVTLF